MFESCSHLEFKVKKYGDSIKPYQFETFLRDCGNVLDEQDIPTKNRLILFPEWAKWFLVLDHAYYTKRKKRHLRRMEQRLLKGMELLPYQKARYAEGEKH